MTEREMKFSDKHFKNIVKLEGYVVKKENNEIDIKIDQITSKNLIKKNSSWIIDKTVFKKPPYTIGKTYGFKEKNKSIDDAVSKGYHKIYFTK